MTAPIGSFFKFLEDKKGKKLTGIDNLKYKLKYAPETLTKQDNEIEGNLNLSDLTSIPKGFNPKVDGALYLNSLTSIPEGFNPKVDGSLVLSGLTSIPEGFNPKVGGSLGLNGLTSIPEGFNPTVNGSLYLSSLTSIPKGFNPKVGGYLYLVNWESNMTQEELKKRFPNVKGIIYTKEWQHQ